MSIPAAVYVRDIQMDTISPPWSLLRPVRENSIEYLELTDSIRDNGLLNSVLVRTHPTIPNQYEIVDGYYRYSVCKDLNYQSLPCIVNDNIQTDEEYLAAQVQANAVKAKTRPIEFAKYMQRLIDIREYAGSPMTLSELATIVRKSSSWVSQRLNLLNLCEEVQEALKNKTISLGKATILSRIRNHKYQKDFLAQSKEGTVRDFELLVGNFIAEKRSDKMSMRQAVRDEPTLQPRIQSMDALLLELDQMSNISEIILRKNLTTAYEGAIIALQWVLNLDEDNRKKQLEEVRHRLNNKERLEIIGRQRYAELKEMRKLREERVKQD